MLQTSRLVSSSSFSKQPLFRRNIGRLASLLLLLGAGLFIGWQSPQPPSHAPANTQVDKNTPLERRCKTFQTGGLRARFQALNCLISLRRTINKRHHPLDQTILKSFRTLYRLLRENPPDWQTVSRWQALYKLGTRLYPLQNRWAEGAAIPVYEVNGHHMSFPFWLKEGLKRDVGPLLHFDSHSDMREIPDHLQVREAVNKLRHKRDTKNAWHIIAHSIRDCAMPVTAGVLSGLYNRVIWAKPADLATPSLFNRSFFFGALRALPSAPPPPATSKHDRLVTESPTGINPHMGNGHGAHKRTPMNQHYRLLYDPADDKKRGKKPLKQGVFWDNVTPGKRTQANTYQQAHSFLFSIIRGELAIGPDGRGKDKALAQAFLKSIPKGVFTLDIDLDYFASIDTGLKFMRTPGKTPHWDRARFREQRDIITKRLKRFETLLLFLKRHKRLPALVTIADSTFLNFAFDRIAEGQSEYTPLEHAAYLRQEMRTLLKKVYGKHISAKQTHPSSPH